MRVIAGTRINYPHGPQEHYFGVRHEHVFPYHLWRPILRLVRSGSRFLRCRRVHNLVWSLRVPGVYLSWAYQAFLTFFAFNRINNLRVFIVAFSPIPTAPTNISFLNNRLQVLERPMGGARDDGDSSKQRDFRREGRSLEER